MRDDLKLELPFSLKQRLGSVFSGSAILDPRYGRDIIKFFGKPVKFEMIFRSSEDGRNSESFHKKCDSRGPLLFVIKGAGRANIFGGYYAGSWSTTGQGTSESWLFSIIGGSNAVYNPVQLLPSSSSLVYFQPKSGPYFGTGPDLRIVSKFTKTTNCSYLSLYKRTSNTSVTIDNNLLAGSPTFAVEELEVFTVK